VAKLKKIGLWPYCRTRFEKWVFATHRAQVETSVTPPPKGLTTDDLRWCVTQYAPLYFVDGAWLGGVARTPQAHDPVHGLLYRTMADELGAGEPEQHHGNIMRKMLHELDVELPAFDSTDFAHWPGFTKAAFATPVYWMAIAHATDTHLPEILGLNLAVEMSGLGATYQSVRQILMAHGVDPNLMDVHISIDNPSTGHTAWAEEAVITYMESQAAQGVADQVAETWRRVWAGYFSLDVVSNALVRTIALRLGPKLGVRKIRRFFGGSKT